MSELNIGNDGGDNVFVRNRGPGRLLLLDSVGFTKMCVLFCGLHRRVFNRHKHSGHNEVILRL